MIKNSSLTQQEITDFLSNIVFKQQSFTLQAQQKVKQNSNLSQKTIMASLVPKIRNFLYELEKHLFIAKKISKLTIYDNGHDYYFEGVIKYLNDIVPSDCRNEFMELYRNSLQTSLDLIWQRHYAYVQSQKRMQIYDSLLQFSESHCLFARVRETQSKQLATNQQLEIEMSSQPYMDAIKLFPRRDLQLILHCFKQTQCHAIKTHRLLLKKGLSTEQYTNQIEFIIRLDNLLLIGAYLLYQKHCEKQLKRVENWAYFKRKAWRYVNFTEYFLVLMRVAIRNDPTIEQVNQVGKIFAMERFHEMDYETTEQEIVHEKSNKSKKSKIKQINTNRALSTISKHDIK